MFVNDLLVESGNVPVLTILKYSCRVLKSNLKNIIRWCSLRRPNIETASRKPMPDRAMVKKKNKKKKTLTQFQK
jgi:hypothetical protein